MFKYKVVGVLLTLGMLAVGSAARYSHSRPKVRGCLPAHDYQVAKYSRTLRSVSSVAVNVPGPEISPVEAAEAAVDPEIQRLIDESVAALRNGQPLPDLTPIQSSIAASNPQVQRFLDALQELRPGETLNLAPPSSLVPAGDAQLQKVFSVVQALRPRDLLARPLTRTSATSTERLSGAKVFQFPNPAVLKIDHCSISEMSVQVHDSGGWELSLRADQNPLDAPPEKKVTTIEDRQLYTDHLQRNQFFVRVQCYANYGRAGRSGLLGKPLVIPLEVEPFFVQKGVPLALVVPGYSSKVKANYASIDRAEIEFYYRTE